MNKKTIGIVFSYEELNANVLFNSVLFNLNKIKPMRIIAYVPHGFESLFYAADLIITIPSNINSFTKYSEVSEYFPIYGNNIITRAKMKLRYLSLPLFLKIIKWSKLKNKPLIFILRFFPTDRAKKFLYKSGIWTWAVKDFYSRVQYKERLLIFHADTRLSFSGQDLILQPDLNESFAYLFSELYEAISTGIVDLYKDKYPKRSNSKLDRQIFIRTRNYKKKQLIHNSKANQILPLINILLEYGFQITNIGSPALSLENSINTKLLKNYSEFDNILTVDEELNILNGPIIMGADAGLFVLICCMPNPIICLTPEWSETFGIHLLDARRKAGFLNDLSHNEFNENFEIFTHLNKVNSRYGE